MAPACSETTRASAEPLAGTAGVVSTWIALSRPKPLWNPDEAVRSEGLPPELEELVLGEKASGRALSLRVFQRGAGGDARRIEAIGLRPRDLRTVHLRDLPPDGIVSILALFCRGEDVGPPLPGPVAFVCTDGRHDRCCAEHGVAVYRTIREESERRGLGLDVVESSHLGGHRFAANCLFLPGGEMYGRLRFEDAPALLQAWSRGRVWVRRFRGRLGAPEPVQVAEAYLRARYPGARTVDLLGAETSGGSTIVRGHVHDAEGTRPVALECRVRSFEGPTACSDPTPKSRLRWAVTAELPVGNEPA